MHQPQRHRIHRKRAFVAVVATLALFATSCGGDDDDDDDAIEADEVTATTEAGADDAAPVEIVNGQGVSDTEIKVGVSVDQTGPYAPLAPGVKAALDAKFAYINANGGVLGRKIVATYLDDKSDPALVLQNFKRFWEQDEVLAIYTANVIGPPLDYVKQQNIPSILLGGPPAVFGSQYPTVIPMGSMTPAWNAQASYAVVNYLDRHPKVVAVTYDPTTEEPLKGWIEDYWKELGAETVIMDPSGSPFDNCDALVLKYKDAGVEYWDMHTPNYFSCVPAQIKANWSPPMGQGGPATSSYEISALIGSALGDVEVLSGSPNSLADGRPNDLEPTPAHEEYAEAMATYAADYAATNNLNSFVPMIMYTAGTFIVDAVTGAAEDAGEISPESIIAWAHAEKDWDPGLADPVASFAPDCKTGNDSTIWGWWKWDAASESLFMEPFAPEAGEPMVNNEWLGVSECYLTELADEFYG